MNTSTPTANHNSFMRRSTRVARFGFLALLLLILLLLIARLLLPHYVLRYVNQVLNRNKTYSGSVADITIHLYRGAYQIHGIKIEKRSKVPVPLFSSPLVDLSIEWRQLFRGALVGEIEVEKPQINFVGGGDGATKQTGKENDWTETVKDLFPVKINTFAVRDGDLHYRDFSTDPKVDIKISDINGAVKNLTNSEDVSKSLVASADLKGKVEGKTPVRVKMDLDPYAKAPTFKVTGTLEKLPLPSINDFLKAYLNVDAGGGQLSLYTELDSKQGKLKGYVKPLLENLDLVSLEADSENPLMLIWESLVSVVAEVLTNLHTDRIATVIPIEGQVGGPETATWSAVVTLFQNAFISGLKPGLEEVKKAAK